MLGFEIGQRESGFYSEQTESQTDRITEPSSTVLVYRCSTLLGIELLRIFTHIFFKAISYATPFSIIFLTSKQNYRIGSVSRETNIDSFSYFIDFIEQKKLIHL